VYNETQKEDSVFVCCSKILCFSAYVCNKSDKTKELKRHM